MTEQEILMAALTALPPHLPNREFILMSIEEEENGLRLKIASSIPPEIVIRALEMALTAAKEVMPAIVGEETIQ